MIGALLRALPADPEYRRNMISVYFVLALMNGGAWLWAFVAFAGNPVLLGVAVVVYGLGLRHAVDADHIAAIDNVTRKLLQQGRKSASIGFWFAVGHSAVVVLATVVFVFAASRLNRLASFRELGGIVSASVSGVFLLFVAVMNVCILLAILRAVRRTRSGQAVAPAELDQLFSGNGILTRLFRPLFRWVSQPWHMAPLGFLFGLSFDTATEVALFSISATQAAQQASLSSALVFPALFAAGMSLLDTTDGIMMVGAYQWGVADPLRKLYYNLAITLLSILVALVIGGVQLSTSVVRGFGLHGSFAQAAAVANDNLNYLGVAVIAVFAAVWLISAAVFKLGARARLDGA